MGVANKWMFPSGEVRTGRVCYQRGCPVTTSVNFSPNIALASLRLLQGLLRLLLITLHFSVVSSSGIKLHITHNITHYITYYITSYITHSRSVPLRQRSELAPSRVRNLRLFQTTNMVATMTAAMTQPPDLQNTQRLFVSSSRL